MTPSEYDQREDSPIDAQLAAPPASYEWEPMPAQDTTSATPFADMMQNRAAVLAVLFLATGALGIPLLWMNERFSKGERVFWSIVVTIYTVILVAIVCWICIWSFRRISGA